jgi:hypothetical protein
MDFPPGLQPPGELRPAFPSDILPADAASMGRDDFVGDGLSAMGATEHGYILQRGSQLFRNENCIKS